MIAGSICQACRERPIVEEIGNEIPDDPYRVCRECGERLRQRALRPLEWFNLAAIHGPSKYLLHDDFYDEDGTACQPNVDDYSTDGRLAPTLDRASRSLVDLIDYCVTRWWLKAPDFEAFMAFEHDAILLELIRRSEAGNAEVFAVTLQLSAHVLGRTAASWVRAQYGRARADDVLSCWAEAAASCLPEPEGLQLTIEALQGLEGSALRERIGALLWFRSPAVLDWIEANAPSAKITNDWGRLAALSNLSWARVQDWVSRGRPLSLIALDALAELIPYAGQSPHFRQLEPKLRECADRAAIPPVLQSYMAVDSAPRVTGTCRYIIAGLDELRIG
jgi:hypothetical protein